MERAAEEELVAEAHPMNKAAAIAGLGALGVLGAVILGRKPGPPGTGPGPSPAYPGPRLVVWAGPVNESQVPGATIPGAILKFIVCTGNGSPSCGQIADSWEDSDGRRLPGMLAQLGLGEGAVGDIFLGAFSAGGSVWKRVLMHPKDRARVRAVVLSDATYTSPVIEPIEGFVRYGLDALQGGKLFVATASASPNKTYGSGEEVLAATRDEIARRSGVSFEAGGSFETSPPPEHIYSAPGILFAHYGWLGGGHMLHPQIAPAVWQNVVQPRIG